MGDDTYDDFDDRADLAAADEIIRWLREDNERLRVELDGERRSGERGRAWSNEQKARIEAALTIYYENRGDPYLERAETMAKALKGGDDES